MKRLLIGGAAVALTIAIAPAIAQPVPPPGVAQGTAPTPIAPVAARPHMMVMSDRVMTRGEVTQHVHKLFARLDTNRDGFITKQELEAVHNKMMGMHADMEKRLGEHGVMIGDRGAMFDRLDANHDGSISRQEFMASRPQLQERRVMILHNGPEGPPVAAGQPGMKMRMHGMGMGGHLFETADANHDGRVSLQEAETAALQHFDRADVNHDGKITPEERGQAHRQMRMEHHPS
jgi:Ca2+-binding EF-hand superfamily protein